MKQSYNNRRRYLISKIFSSFLIFLLLLSLTGCESFPAIPEDGQSAGETLIETEDSDSPISMEEIPAYSGEPYIEINENVPRFDEEDYRREPFEPVSYTHLFHPGLLQHDLRDPYVIRLFILSPRETSLIFPVPVQQNGCKCLIQFFFHTCLSPRRHSFDIL